MSMLLSAFAKVFFIFHNKRVYQRLLLYLHV